MKMALLIVALFAATNSNSTSIIDSENVVKDFPSLQQAIANANENLTTIIHIDSFELPSASLMDAMRNLNIDGKNIIIKGINENTTITSVKAGTIFLQGSSDKTNRIAFENITFEQKFESTSSDKFPNSAIAISSGSTSIDLCLKNCTFKNFANVKGSGGALQVSFSNQEKFFTNINIENCNFMNNSSLFSGGAIAIDAIENVNLNIKNCNFEYSMSPRGGAISLNGLKNANIKNCSFKNGSYLESSNDDFHGGGAIRAISTPIKINSCYFNENSFENGGALFLSNCKSIVSNNTFIDNLSSIPGSNSLFVESPKNLNGLIINNSFINNLDTQSKECSFNIVEGNIQSEIKTKLYFNTFLTNQNKDNSSSDNKEHFNELANLHVSPYYKNDIFTDEKCAFTSSSEAVKTVKNRFLLTNNDNFKLKTEDYEEYLSTFYLNTYGEFYIGNNQTDQIQLEIDGKVKQYNIDDEVNIEHEERFGFDYVENRVNGRHFESSNSLISSQKPIKISSVYKLNSAGGLTYIGLPILLFLIVGVLFTIFKLHKLQRVKDGDNVSNSFDVEQWSKQSVNNPVFKCLTTKEKEIMELVFKGTPRKEIAAKLFISESTVKNHVTKIYSKLNVKNRAELLKLLRK